MNSGKGIITISVHNDITQEEIKEIRDAFKQDKHYQDYKLNIVVSGKNDFKENLKKFIFSH